MNTNAYYVFTIDVCVCVCVCVSVGMFVLPYRLTQTKLSTQNVCIYSVICHVGYHCPPPLNTNELKLQNFLNSVLGLNLPQLGLLYLK